MDYYFLDLVSWQHSQLLYHAAAHLGREAILVLRPATPYVCLGFHQDVRQEVDVDFARRVGLPLIRREVGGGTIFASSDQLFYLFIFRKDHPALPRNKEEIYRKFLSPVIHTLRHFGVPAEFKPVNDILAGGRKISGSAAGEVSEMMMLVGTFLLDFNYELMSKVLRIPDEKYRDKLYKTLQDNLTSIRREVGQVPSTEELSEVLRQQLEPALGSMTVKTEADPELLAEAERLGQEMICDEWLFANDSRQHQTQTIKIRDGVYLLSNTVKLPGGLVRSSAVNDHGFLKDVHLSGDFFIYPRESVLALEKVLEGQAASLETLTACLLRFYQEHQVEAPGLAPEALAQVIAGPNC